MLTSKTRSSINLDLLTADVQTLQIHLQEGRLKSVDLVDMHLEMIQKHDGYLKAMLSLVPKQRLRQISEALDQERSEGKLRGPLHGIPIVIKVSESLE
jgi:amidase